jgi:hypothetical protein
MLTFNYNSGVDDRISRVSSLLDGSPTLESYSYLGLGTVEEEKGDADIFSAARAEAALEKRSASPLPAPREVWFLHNISTSMES